MSDDPAAAAAANLAAVRRYVDAWLAGDFPGMMATYADGFVLHWFGVARQEPGVPLTLLGLPAPGCSAHIAGLLGSVDAPASSGSSALAVTVPANPSLLGVELTAQALALTIANAAFVATSNGVAATFGR